MSEKECIRCKRIPPFDVCSVCLIEDFERLSSMIRRLNERVARLQTQLDKIDSRTMTPRVFGK